MALGHLQGQLSPTLGPALQGYTVRGFIQLGGELF